MGTATFTVSVDLAVLAVRDGVLQALHEQPGHRWALPGRLLDVTVDLEAEVEQVLAAQAEHTGPVAHLEQVRAFGPHVQEHGGQGVSVGYLVLTGPTSSAVETECWAPVERLLASQQAAQVPAHREVLQAAVERLRSLLEHTTAAAALCAPTFTVPELHQVYEAVWGRPLDSRNFHRKITGATGFLEPTGERTTGTGRPAVLYRRGPATQLHPALSRE
ncbi:NUDIX hydrolase [Lentzea chajnantorensis]